MAKTKKKSIIDKCLAKCPRVSAEERKKMIIEAAAPLFAEQGFAGTTTKQIAKTAGVSEGLLYKYFPSKEILYQKIQLCVTTSKHALIERFMSMPDNADTLIPFIYFFYENLFLHKYVEPDKQEMVTRLMISSLLEDGQYIKGFLEERVKVVMEKFTRCFNNAVQEGDIIEGFIPPNPAVWFGYLISMSFSFLELPKEKMIDFNGTPEEMLGYSLRFALRGMGFKDEVIKTKADPKKLAAKLEEMKKTE